MARNHEKNYGRLNRLWIEKRRVKSESRPKLSALKTSDEISYWLPSIKNELDFVLKQTEVPCYSEQKIEEYHSKIRNLEADYQAFVRKLHQVNGTLKSTPWTARPYEKKNNSSTKKIPTLHPMDNNLGSISFNSLETPVLQHDYLYEELEFDEDGNSHHTESPANEDSPLKFQDLSPKETVYQTVNPSSMNGIEESLKQDSHPTASVNVLGLDYSSSSSDEDNQMG
ncbi:NAD kinase 2 [Frankliniella fusca]|uniref:NAD kinase 2 n=1 Tax=Frankliniella fusca TaxID=407009 RepID=A0AAE1LFW2_9NEOP|nr:NAD kinase 2 [Frankliniella fusca]